MTTSRLVAIGFIFCCTAFAWSILGTSVVHRTGESDDRLAQEVACLGRPPRPAGAAACGPAERPCRRPSRTKDAAGKVVSRTVTRTADRARAGPLDSEPDHGRASLTRAEGCSGTTRTGRLRRPVRRPQPDVPRSLSSAPVPGSAQADHDGFRFTVNGQETAVLSDLGKRALRRTVLPPRAPPLSTSPTARAASATGCTPSAPRWRRSATSSPT